MSWLEILSYIAIAIGVIQFLVITIDVIRHPQVMFVMNVVWPITGLYFPVAGIWFYFKLGRKDRKNTIMLIIPLIIRMMLMRVIITSTIIVRSLFGKVFLYLRPTAAAGARSEI